MRRRDFPTALALTAAGSMSLSTPAASASLLTCQAVPAQTYPPGHLFRYLSEAQRIAFLASDTTLALTTELQTWVEQSRCAGVTAYLPRGTAKTSAPLVLSNNDIIRGEGSLSRIVADGCNCIEITGHRVTIEKVGLFGNRTHDGITIAGQNEAGTLTAFTGRDLYLQDFRYAVNGEYMSHSTLDNVEIWLSIAGVRLFGRSVNNRISNSRFECAGGFACILTIMNAGERGEGLMVTNSLLAGADNAFRSNGFLGVGFYNCICDILKGVGFDMVGVEAFTFNGPWVDAVNACFKWADIGAETDIGASITVGRARTNGSDNVIHWGVNNRGLSVTGGQLILEQGAGFPLAIYGNEVSVTGVHIVTDDGRAPAWIAGDDVHLTGVTGIA